MKKYCMLIIFLIQSVCFPIDSTEPIQRAEYVEEVSVDVELGEYLSPDKPLTGTVMVTHDKRLKVDESSFSIGDKRLQVKKVRNQQISKQSPLIISIYTFEFDPEVPGDHTLPPISINVGGKRYQSQPVSYAVDQ